MKKERRYQHQPLRVPRGWTDQERALVIQIDSLFDELFTKVGQLRNMVEGMAEQADQPDEEE